MPATSRALVPSGDEVPTTPGPMATMTASAEAHVPRQGQGRWHRHRLEIATERVAGRDGDVDEAGRW